MIARLLAWLRREPKAPHVCPRCVACQTKDEMIRLIKRELDFNREQVASLFELVGARPPEVPSGESEAPALTPPEGAEPYRRPEALSRRLSPWSQSLAAGGHVDVALARRHLELTRIPGRAQPAAYDEGFPVETTERDQ